MITPKKDKTNSSKSKKKISSGLSRSATKRATDATKNAIITVQSYKDLDLIDIKILIVLMNEKKDFTQKEISERCEASPSTVSRHLLKLRKNRYVKKVQGGKISVHKLTKKGFNVGCTFLEGYEGDFKDRLHNVKAHCFFKIKRKRFNTCEQTIIDIIGEDKLSLLEILSKAKIDNNYSKYSKKTLKKRVEYILNKLIRNEVVIRENNKYYMREEGIIRWKSHPVRNWNQLYTWIDNVYVWYSDKGNKIHYQLPHIFADTADEATEKAFELIRRVNKQLKKEGFVFTSRPEIEHEGIIITDSHHAAFLEPLAIWLKKQEPPVSLRYKDLVEYDSSFKKVPEMDFIKFPYNHEHFERYMENVAIPAMMGEIKKEDIMGASEDRKVSMSLLMEQREKIQEMNKNIEIMYDQFGKSLTGQTVIITQLPQFIQAVANLSHAVTEAFLKKDKDEEKIRELEEKFEVQEVGKDDKTFLLIKNIIKNLLLKIFFFFKKLV